MANGTVETPLEWAKKQIAKLNERINGLNSDLTNTNNIIQAMRNGYGLYPTGNPSLFDVENGVWAIYGVERMPSQLRNTPSITGSYGVLFVFHSGYANYGSSLYISTNGGIMYYDIKQDIFVIK